MSFGNILSYCQAHKTEVDLQRSEHTIRGTTGPQSHGRQLAVQKPDVCKGVRNGTERT